jgi:cell wall-associated NlpC family hydrolase
METWEQVVRGLVGKPFQWQGRGPDGYDCWGLVREALQRLGKVTPPDFVTETKECATRTLQANLRGHHAVRQETPEPGDVAMLSTRETIHHTGLLTPFGILHTTLELGCCIMSEATLRARGYQRIEYYRWVE